jgi:hypothetical protein
MSLLSQLNKDEQVLLFKATGIIRCLRELTSGRFRDGAVARVLAMEFWTNGKAPTLADFARAWTKADANKHELLTAEYAYLTDPRGQGLEEPPQSQSRIGSAHTCKN